MQLRRLFCVWINSTFELGLGRIFRSSNICLAMHECQISDTNFYPQTFSTFPNSSGDIMIYGQSDILSKYTDSFSLSSLNSDWLDDVIYVKTEKEKIQTSTYELVNQELEKYDAEPQIRGDPLQWWKSREASMPILAEVARAILCVPGSSVPSERVFSKSGQLLNKKRASLKSKNVDMLIFLNKNYPFKHSSK